jgi:hypothetical protein
MIKQLSSSFYSTTTVLLGLLAASAARADIISYVGTTVQANGTVAPGADYAFFGGGKPESLTDFSVTSFANASYPGPGVSDSYSTLIAPGTASVFQTGVIYNTTKLGQTFDILNFQTTSASVTSFDVWVLDGNSDGNSVGNSSVTLTDGGAQSVTEAVVPTGATPPAYLGINQFTEFSVSGATPSDVFSLDVTPAGADRYPTFSGITFEQVVATPEPSSLIGGGLVVLAFATVSLRRRMRKQKTA